MNILFIHSGSVITGSVTYARALEHAWLHAHRVFWANDGSFLAPYYSLVVGLRRKLFPYGLFNVLRITRYVREQKIELLHAHSRRANLAAALVSKLTGVPYVVTAHMRTQPRPANRLWPCWGDRTIAICETVEAHLREVHRIAPERIQLIRNGIDMTAFQPGHFHMPGQAASGDQWITVLGRLSGKRWNAVEFLLSLIPEVARTFPTARFRFVGWVDPVHEATLQAAVGRLNSGRRQALVEVLGHVDDPRPLVNSSTLVIAAGRSLMEAMAMEIPVIAVGEQSVYGLMTPENFEDAQKTNFGDFPWPGENSFDAVPVLQGIRTILKQERDLLTLRRWGRERITRDYDITKIADQVNQVYSAVSVLPKSA